MSTKGREKWEKFKAGYVVDSSYAEEPNTGNAGRDRWNALKKTIDIRSTAPRQTAQDDSSGAKKGFFDRLGLTVSGGAKGSLAGNMDAMGVAYEAGQSGRTRRDTAELKDAQWAVARAKHDYDADPSEVNKSALEIATTKMKAFADVLGEGAYEQALEAAYDAAAQFDTGDLKALYNSLGVVTPKTGTGLQQQAAEAARDLAVRVQDSAAEDIQEAKDGTSKFWQMAIDAGASATQMALDAASNAVLGTNGSMVPFATRAFGGATMEARQGGADIGKQALYGAAQTAKEVFTEKMFNIALPYVKTYGKGGFDGIVENGIRKAADKLGKSKIGKAALEKVLTFGASAATEGMEELIGDWMEWQLPRIYGGDVATAEETLSDSLYDFVVGFMSGMIGGAMTGPMKAINSAVQAREVKKEYGAQQLDLVNKSEELSPGNELAKKYRERLDGGKNLSGRQLIRLMQQNETDMLNGDKAKIQDATEKRLTELGESDNVRQLAEIVARQMAGEELSLDEQMQIDGSKYGKRVLGELNPENVKVDENGNPSDTYSSSWTGSIGTSVIYPVTFNRDIGVTGSKYNPETGKLTIVSDKDKKLKLKTESGEIVDAKDVNFRSKDEAMVYSAVLDMGVSPVVAQSIVDNFDGTDGRVYAADVKLAYQYGKMNFPKSYLDKLDIKPHQAEHAYNLGRSDAKAEAVAPKTKRTVKGKRGTVIFETAVDESTLTPIQHQSINGIKAIADLSGLNVHVFESRLTKDGYKFTLPDGTVTGANGWYVTGTNDIWIDLNAGNAGEGTMLYTAAHEISHFIKEWSPTKWRVLADFLLEQYGEDVPLDALLERQMAKVRKNNPDLQGNALMDAAYEELVCDAMSEMLVDGEVVQKLAELKQKDKTLWEKIKDAIRDLLEKWGLIRKEYEGRSVAGEAAFLRGMDEAFKKLQQLYTEAFAEASENYQADQTLAEAGIAVNAKTDSGSLFSVRDVLSETDRKKVAKALAERFAVTEVESMEWLKAETSLASLILNPKYSAYLDYEGDPDEVAIKKNSDYPQGTVDFSNICKKRREFTQVMNRVLRNFPHHVFAATDLAKIRTIMGQEGMTLPCGICYVEDRRQLDSIVAQDFINSLKLYREGSKTRPDGKPFNANQLKGLQMTDGDSYVPSIYELVTLEGRNSLKAKNPNMEAAWVRYNNARGMQSVRLLTNEAEYKRQILKYSPDTVRSKNDLGGLRIYSFSDMEMFHLIDIVQVITDSATVGLSLQGYTKVNEYARAVKDTGEKLNRSLIPAGDLGYHIEDGKVVLDYDTVEGIDIHHEDFFDNRDNPNVGNIVIGINDTQIRAAMVSDFIDQIIPFHTGQSEDVLGEKGIAAWNNYKDFQTEKDLATGKTAAHQINIYTEVIQAAEQEGKPIQNKRQFVEKFLAVCKQHGLKPRFAQFLNTDANGDYIYTEGYHKFLVDFKTFAQTEVGEYLPQMPVKPIFDNAYMTGLLKAYVTEQQTKDTEVAKQMPRVIERITNEVIKSGEVKRSERDADGEEVLYSDRDQEYESKDTSVKILPATFTKFGLKPTDRVLDWGGGQYDIAKKAVEHGYPGIKFEVVDAFNRTETHNDRILAEYKADPATVLTINNVLNVIKETEIIEDVIRESKEYLAADGVCYIKIYEGNDVDGKTGNGKVTSSGWQNNQPAEWYRQFAEKYYQHVERVGDILIASDKPIDRKSLPKVDKDVAGAMRGKVKEIAKSEASMRESLYSDRDTDSVSNRDILANAFMDVAQNDVERSKIAEYQQKIKALDEDERKLRDIRAQLHDLSFSAGPRDNAKIRELREKATKLANRIGIQDKQLLRLEASKPLMAVLEREKKLAYSRASQKWEDRIETARTGRSKTEMRHKIKKIVGELNNLLLHGTKDKHIMIGLQKATAEALSAINMDTVAAEKRLAKIQAKIDKATDPAEKARLQQSYARVEAMGDNMATRLTALKNAYEEIKDSGDPLVANAYQPEIEERIKNLRKMVGDTPLRNMSMEQLEFTYDTYKMVLTAIRNANKAFKNERGESIAVLGNRSMEEIGRVGGKKELVASAMRGPLGFAWSGMKPTYAFKAIGSNTLSELFSQVRAGEDVWATDVNDAKEFYSQKTKQYNYDSWDLEKEYTFTSKSGKEFKLTLEQIMSLYAYSKRKQADAHLDKGGFVFDSSIEVVKRSKLGIPVKYRVNTAHAHALSRDTLMEICKTLTDEQVKFVDEMQDYLSTVMGEKGNEVSLKMYGVKLFKEKFYFPLKSAKQFMYEQYEVAGDRKIKNSGFSKDTTPHASNPVILNNFTDVWATHVNDMAMYHAFVLPMEDFERVFNYKTPTSDTMPTESVKGYLQDAYGVHPEQYIKQLMTDLNGGARIDPTAGIINKGIALFKKSAVFASLSVVIQQPSAIARAMAYIDAKYFVGKPGLKDWDEVKKYAPVAIIKEMGYFDTNMGKSTVEFIKAKEYTGVKSKMNALVTDRQYRDEILSKAPSVADELAWCQIWNAVKKEIAETKKLQGEELLQAAGKRFTEVIVNTQVYDSVLTRSGMMRSKDTGMKMATSFMAEPTTSLNMIVDALIQGKRGNKSYARKAIGAVAASMILNSILVSFVYAGRDDDEDKTYAEKYVGSLTSELIDSFNPLTLIPFVKDIVSIAQGYDVERSDMAVITDLFNAWKKLSSDNLSVYRKVEGFGGTIASIFGLPLKNIMRDVRGIYNTVKSAVAGPDTTGRGVLDAARESLPKWMGGGERSNADQLYAAMLSGDTGHVERLKARFKDDRAFTYAVRDGLVNNDKRITAAAEARAAGNQNEYMRLAREIVNEGHFSQDDVVRAVNYVLNSLTKKES